MAEAERGCNVQLKYKVAETIGNGSFAKVYAAKQRKTGKTVALKIIPKALGPCDERAGLSKREIDIMKSLDHPFIVHLYEVIEESTSYVLSMEYLSNGSLLNYINNNGALNETHAKKLVLQLVCALSYLHNDRNIIHRDIKLENILLDVHENVRLIDFGLSKGFLSENPVLTTNCGSPAYVAPEILCKESYTTSADIWSLGVVLYSMLAGQLPFSDPSFSKQLRKIVNCDPKIPSFLSSEAQDLLEKMLKKDPKQRITLIDIVKHPWIQQPLPYGFTTNTFITYIASLQSFDENVDSISDKIVRTVSVSRFVGEMLNNMDMNQKRISTQSLLLKDTIEQLQFKSVALKRVKESVLSTSNKAATFKLNKYLITNGMSIAYHSCIRRRSYKPVSLKT